MGIVVFVIWLAIESPPVYKYNKLELEFEKKTV